MKKTSDFEGQKRNCLGGSGEAISALPDGDVEDQLLHLHLPHRIRELLLCRLKSQQKSCKKEKKKNV